MGPLLYQFFFSVSNSFSSDAPYLNIRNRFLKDNNLVMLRFFVFFVFRS